MDTDLLTIKQFAEAAGITQQAVYKQLNNRLNGYVVIINDGKRKRMLKKEGLKEFSTVKQQDNNQFNTLLSQNQQIIDMLKKELEEKNQQITELEKLLDQQQKLTGMTQAKVLELEEKVKETEKQEQDQEPEQPKKWFEFWKR